MKQIDADALEEKLDKIPARRIENADGRAYVLIRLSTVFEIIKQMPPAQPEPSEITDEQAILHLQSTGWMQNHDREMYESGLREQLADDSGGYDSLIPCEDTISRQAAIGEVKKHYRAYDNDLLELITFDIERLPSAQPEQRWIPCSERLPEKEGWYITTVESEKTGKRRIENDLFAVDIALAHGHTPNKFCKDGYRQRTVAWMPFPEPYCGGK